MANSIFEWEKKYKIWINVLALLFFPLAVIAGITLASHSFGWILINMVAKEHCEITQMIC